jgi:type II secretory pathway predicted ATPase ExeA
MYEQHFGLDKRPFRSDATGKDVFVGPSVAAAMAGMKKALSANDAIVTVSGAVGSGKTTLAEHTLASFSGHQIIVRVARMRLDSSDVLELLLDRLDINDKPTSTLQRFAVLRRTLRQLEKDKTRVFVIIEDGVRLGADTLAEIETLTSADAGPSEGASVILMGDDSLTKLLEDAQLARIQQRIRRRVAVAPLSVTELHGYLRHSFRVAGGEFETIFEGKAAAVLHDLSGGVPRICNNLVVSAMTAAADQNQQQVATQLLGQIAESDYGLSTEIIDVSAPIEAPAQQDPEPEPVPESEPVPEPEPVAEPEPAAEAEPVPEPAPEPASNRELIELSVPDLKILSPDVEHDPTIEIAILEEPSPEPDPDPVGNADLTELSVPDLQTLSPDVERDPTIQLAILEEPVSESEPEPVPEAPSELQLDSEATVAEMEPDLDALEQAMAFAKGGGDELLSEDDEGSPESEPKAIGGIPEITLDGSISERVKTAQLKIPDEESPEASTDASTTPVPAAAPVQDEKSKADAELAQIALELSRAKSLEDIDDKLAETLFGEEINSIAAQFAVKSLEDNPPPAEPPAKPPSQPANEPANADAPSDGLVLELVSDPGNAPAKEAPRQVVANNKPITVSQRLRTVRALNDDPKPATPNPDTSSGSRPPISEPPGTPVSIEDQFSTSTPDTQTQKASINHLPVPDDDEDEKNSKTGFFSRFKRS